MVFDFLPREIFRILYKLDNSLIYQMRFREDYPVKINYDEKEYYLSDEGITLLKCDAFVCQKETIDEIINNATKKSLYAFNDRIKEGYITTDDGIRIGISGECVFENGIIQTIKNISSLNIRIPHEIKDCSAEIFNKIYGAYIYNTLIVSRPFYGKTTILKDLSKRINDLNKYSILIIDERGEFSSVSGENIDKIVYSDKRYAFNIALRSMSPDIVITDELCTAEDWKCAFDARNSGVKIIASCHAENIEEIENKEYFTDKIFDRYVVLSCGNSIGKIYKIYDNKFCKI